MEKSMAISVPLLTLSPDGNGNACHMFGSISGSSSSFSSDKSSLSQRSHTHAFIHITSINRCALKKQVPWRLCERELEERFDGDFNHPAVPFKDDTNVQQSVVQTDRRGVPQ